VALKNYYELLEIAPNAPADEVKRAFRTQIARYHPDRVQHLGKEFQSMAADRAAELTGAYRILSDSGRRAEYDRAFADAGGATAPAVSEPPPQPGAPEAPPVASPPPPSSKANTPPRGGQFKEERVTRDEFVRKATLSRLRQALDAVGGGYDESQLRGVRPRAGAEEQAVRATRTRRCSGDSSRTSIARRLPTPGCRS
jgi:curved DNA-binding protein CbpA